jgi:hypothetical protein
MKRIQLVAATGLILLPLAASVQGATTINISTNIAVSDVKRFGIGLAQHNYYDSAQMMKELLFRNPGFEGLLYRSVVRLGTNATAASAIEDQPYGQWPSGFWAGAGYEVIWSSASAKGRSGIVTSSLAPNRVNTPNDPAGNAQGTTYLFGDSDPARIPASGDYLVLRKTETGGTGGGAAFTSWDLGNSGGGTITSETADLPGDAEGQQCVRLTALATGQQAALRGRFDTLSGFVRLDGQFRLAFKAKGCGGANRLLASVRRGSLTPYLSQTIQLASTWTNCSLAFSAAEASEISGTVTVEFSPVSQSAALLDDVSLRQTDSSPDNPTEFRDAVVDALRGLKPGILRYVNWQDLGNSLDNELAPVFARKRSGYSVYSTSENNMMPGLHEFLALSEHIGSEPWYSIPPSCSTQEVANLMEYLGGTTNTPYGLLRARRGRSAPWTNAFSRIHLEFGNENWNNSSYRGGCLSSAVPCGNRASEFFAAIKGSPYYASSRFTCILGGWTASYTLNQQLHNASPLHDSLTLAPYMSGRVDSYASTEELFGPLFAEPEWWSFNPSPTTGLMRLTFDTLQASSRPVPLSVYEVNLHTTEGAISQPALDSYTPSIGAALAVADHMLVMLRELGCRDQLFFSLPGNRFTRSDTKTVALWGAVLDMGKTNRKRPSYEAQRLLNESLAGDLLQTAHSGDNPTWSVTNMNRVSYTGAHAIQSFAFRSHGQRALLIFNLLRTAAHDVAFSGPLAPTGTVTLTRLTSSAITDNNESNTVVSTVTQTLTGFAPTQALTLPPFSLTRLQWAEPGPVLSGILPAPLQQAVHVQWEGRSDRRYRIQYSDDLLRWSDAGPAVSGANATLTFIDDGTLTGGGTPFQSRQRFYRVLSEP